MQTRRARPEQLWAPLRRRPSTLDGRRSSQSLVFVGSESHGFRSIFRRARGLGARGQRAPSPGHLPGAMQPAPAASTVGATQLAESALHVLPWVRG